MDDVLSLFMNSQANLESKILEESNKKDTQEAKDSVKEDVEKAQKALKEKTKALNKELKTDIKVEKEKRSAQALLQTIAEDYGQQKIEQAREAIDRDFSTDIDKTLKDVQDLTRGYELASSNFDTNLDKALEKKSKADSDLGNAEGKLRAVQSLLGDSLNDAIIDNFKATSTLDDKTLDLTNQLESERLKTNKILEFQTTKVDTTQLFNSIYSTTVLDTKTISKEEAVGQIKAAKATEAFIREELNLRSDVISEINKVQNKANEMKEANERALIEDDYNGPTYALSQIEAQENLAKDLREGFNQTYGEDFLDKADIKQDKKDAKLAREAIVDTAKTDYLIRNLSDKISSDKGLNELSSSNDRSFKNDYKALVDELKGKNEEYKTQKETLTKKLNEDLRAIDNDFTLSEEERQERVDQAYDKYWKGEEGVGNGKGMTELKQTQKLTEKQNSEELKYAREYYNRSKALSDDEFYASQWEDEAKLNSVYEWGKFISHEEVFDFSGVLESDDFFGAMKEAIADQMGDVVKDTAKEIGNKFLNSLKSFKLTQKPGIVPSGETNLNKDLTLTTEPGYPDAIKKMIPIQIDSSNTDKSVFKYSFVGSGSSNPEGMYFTLESTPGAIKPSLTKEKASTPESESTNEEGEEEETTNSKYEGLELTGPDNSEIRFKKGEIEDTPIKEALEEKRNQTITYEEGNFKSKTETEPGKVTIKKPTQKKTDSTELDLVQNELKVEGNGRRKGPFYDLQDTFINQLPMLMPAFTEEEKKDNLTSLAIHKILTSYPLRNQSLYLLYVPHLEGYKELDDTDEKETLENAREVWDSYLVTGITLPGMSRQTTNEVYGQTLLSLIAENNVMIEGKASIKIMADRGMRVYSQLSRLAGTSIENKKFETLAPKKDTVTKKWFEGLKYRRVYNMSSIATYPDLSYLSEKDKTKCAYLQLLDGRYLQTEFFLQERTTPLEDSKFFAGHKEQDYLELQNYNKSYPIQYEELPLFKLNNFAVRNLEMSFDFSASNAEKLLELNTSVTWSSIEFVRKQVTLASISKEEKDKDYRIASWDLYSKSISE